MVEHDMGDVAERATKMYAVQIDAVKESVEQLPKESPIRYISKETLTSDAQWLDSVEKESIQEGFTGKEESLREQLQFALDHVHGAMFPEDDSIFYGVKGSTGDLGGYVLTYAIDEDHLKNARKANLLDKKGTTYREVSPFMSKHSDISQDQMIEALRASLVADRARFSSAENPVNMAFVVFEPDSDGSLYETLGFQNKGMIKSMEEMPSGLEPQEQTVWVLAGEIQ
jgi:hypothetical protein